jgi:isoleucyl-tRNA synthetase
MHKSWGNAIWFDDAVEKMGADVMRWMYSAANITQNMNFGFGIGEEVKRNLLTLWNTYSFFVMYANLDGFVPEKATVPVAERAELDRWILARLNELVGQARAELDEFDVASVTRQVDAFVEDLSNWYVRRSRRRFWKSESDSDKLSAYSTLYEVLVTLAKVIAPIMPFLSEEMYQNLVRSGGRNADAPESVHHCAYPEMDASLVDRRLLDDVALAQRVVSLGRSARNKASVKVRQPLREIVVRVPNRADEEAMRRIEPQVLEELNIKQIELTPEVGDLITYVIKPNFAQLGPKYGKRLGAVREALAALDPAEVAARVQADETVSLTVAGESEPVELLPSEVVVETREREGFAVAQEGGLVVALDTELDDDLLREGLARDLVRVINDMRKSAGFDVSDRITTYVTLEGPEDGDRMLAEGALQSFRDYIAAETLTHSLVEGEAEDGAYRQDEKVGNATLHLAVKR